MIKIQKLFQLNQKKLNLKEIKKQRELAQIQIHQTFFSEMNNDIKNQVKDPHKEIHQFLETLHNKSKQFQV